MSFCMFLIYRVTCLRRGFSCVFLTISARRRWRLVVQGQPETRKRALAFGKIRAWQIRASCIYIYKCCTLININRLCVRRADNSVARFETISISRIFKLICSLWRINLWDKNSQTFRIHWRIHMFMQSPKESCFFWRRNAFHTKCIIHEK